MKARRAKFSGLLWQGSAVDAEAGVVRGVAVVTIGEAKGHGVYADAKTLETVLSCAAGYANGVRVKVEHDGDLLDTVGLLKNWRIDGETLRADLHLLQSDPAARQKILEMAASMPDTFGLSIEFEFELEEIGERMHARCKRLLNVALVEEPAANPALFSAMEPVTKEEVAAIVAEALKPIAERIAAVEATLVETDTKPDATPEVEVEMAELKQEFAALKAELSEKLNTSKDAAVATLATKLGIQDVNASRWTVAPVATAGAGDKYAELKAAFADARKQGLSFSRAALAARRKNPGLYDDFIAEYKGNISKLN